MPYKFNPFTRQLDYYEKASGAPGSGEANTASNYGATGVGLYHSKLGVDLRFKNLRAGSNKLTVTNEAVTRTVAFDVDASNILHQDLDGAGTKTHAEIDTHLTSGTKTHAEIDTHLTSGTKTHAEIDTHIGDADIHSPFPNPKIVFSEQFTGDGNDTTFILSGTILNGTFTSGSWAAGQIQTTYPSHVTLTDKKPAYDSTNIFTRNRVSVVSINSGTGEVTLSHAPRNGIDFIIWYWYEVDDTDIIDDYRREDFIASMETESSGSIASAVNVDTSAFNGVLGAGDTDVQTALETIDDNAIAATEFNANTILKADSDDTPIALTVAEQTLVGRITSGVITALTATQVRTLINVEDGADVTDATNVEAAGAIMETLLDVKGDLLVATADNTVIRLPVGTNDYVLTADSGEASGVKWAAASTGAVDSVFGRTGVVEAAASDYDATQIDMSASDRILGRTTAGAGLTEELTAAQVRGLINVEDGADVTDATNVAAAGAIMETLVGAKGDLLVGTADDTVARLPVGADDYVLTADSAEGSGVKWAALPSGLSFIGLTDTPVGYTTANAIYTTNSTPNAVIETAVVLTEGGNTFNITKGTASLDIAASAALDVDANLTVSGASFLNQDLRSTASPTFVALQSLDYIDFDTTGGVAAQEGRVSWNADEGTLNIGMPGGSVNLQVGHKGLILVRNVSGSTIDNGKIVYVTGASGNKITVDLADRSDADKIMLLGMATESISHNTNGYVALWGTVRGAAGQAINTSSYAEGTTLYLSTSGDWTDAHPSSAADATIVIGTVRRQHATEGEITLLVHPFTIGNNYDGSLRQSIINKSTGTSAAAAFTAVNDLGHWMTVGIGGSNNAAFGEVAVFYGPGYDDNLYTVDGNKSHKWYVDPTDSHDNSSLNYLSMELNPSGDLIISRGQITSTIAIGTAPLAVTSTTVNTNLNADLLDGYHGAYYLNTGSTLDDLYDVDTTGVIDEQVIAYDAYSGTWLPATVLGVTELSDLTDVDTSGVTHNQALLYNASVAQWLPTTLTTSDISDFDTAIETNAEVVLNILHRTTIAKLNGFEDGETEVSETFTDGSRTLLLTPTGDSYKYWVNGVQYTKTAPESIVIPNTEGLHIVYYDGATLTSSTTWSNSYILEKAIVAVIYWDATNSKQILFTREHYHGANMSGATHLRMHDVDGYALEYGGGLGDFTIGNGDLAAHAEFSCEASECHDEDAEFDLPARLSTDILPVYYRTGADASDIWRIDESTSFPVLTTGTGRAAWNELTGGNWQLTEVSNNDYVLAHVALTNDTDRPFIVFMGQATYGNISAARSGAEVEVNNLIVDGLPGPEITFVGTVILQTSSGNANAVKSQIVQYESGVDYVDLRGKVIGRSGSSTTVTDHGALAGLTDDDHSQYALLAGRTGGQILYGSDTTAEDLTLGDNSVDGNTITVTQIIAAYTHVSSDGTDHSYIDQDVTSGSSPTFDGTNFTGIPNGALDETYINADGTVGLTGDWDAGSYEIRAQTFESDVATGTAPLTIASTTLVTNLNADLLDSQEGSYYLDRTNHTGTQTASTISDFDTEVSNNVDVAANTTHRSSDGTDHTYIDQDVTSGSSPTFDGTNFAGIPNGALDETYINANGTVGLSANWDAGSYEIRAQTFQSDITTGTAPFIVASTTVVANLNADLLDGSEGSYYLDRTNHTGTQTASTISDFDTEVSNNTDVAANTTHRSSDGTDHGYINQDVTSGSSPTFATVYGTTFDTNVSAAGVTLAGTTLAADGTDTHIDITITPKGNAGIVLPNAASAPADTTNKLYQTGGVLYFDGVSLEGALGAHDFGGASHNADTIANVRTKVSDATLVAVTGTPTDTQILIWDGALGNAENSGLTVDSFGNIGNVRGLRFDVTTQNQMNLDDSAGTERKLRIDIPVVAGGTSGNVLEIVSQIDDTTLFGVTADTDGAASYEKAVGLTPYYSGAYGASWASGPDPEPVNVQNGAFIVAYNSDETEAAIGVRANGSWEYIRLGGGGSGDVVGPGSATDNAIARFDTTTGKLIQNSGVTIDDSDVMTGVENFVFGSATTSNANPSVAGVTSYINWDLPVAAGGAAAAALDYQFKIDGTLEFGLVAETDGAGSYENQAAILPYYSGDYDYSWSSSIPEPEPTSIQNGGIIAIYNTETTTTVNDGFGLRVRANGEWKTWRRGRYVHTFLPKSYEPPSSSYATIDERNDRPCLDFDDDVDESARWTNCWTNYSGDDIVVTIIWAASSATSGNVVWSVRFERVLEDTEDMDSTSWASYQSVTAATAGVSGDVKYTTITFTRVQADYPVDNTYFRMEVLRDANNGSDTMSGDAEIFAVIVEEA
jgi:hypothetical protein